MLAAVEAKASSENRGTRWQALAALKAERVAQRVAEGSAEALAGMLAAAGGRVQEVGMDAATRDKIVLQVVSAPRKELAHRAAPGAT